MKNTLSFDIAQKKWISYMVDCIERNIVYKDTLSPIAPCSFEEYIKPDIYFLDGIKQEELPKRWEGKEYYSNQIQSFQDWYNSI